MSDKTLPFTCAQLEAIAASCPTPFHLYDETGILANARRLKAAFAWNAGFREYFAVKATPNPFLLTLLKREGFGMDCSSLAELVLSERVGVTGEAVMFTSNDTPAEEFLKAKALGAVINLDDITHIPFLEACAGLPELVCFRYNPGPLKGGNAIIGNPEQAKYGFTRAQLFEGYRLLKQKGVRRFGLHTMVASNELNPQYFIDTAEILFDLVADLSRELGITFEFVNLGGGIGIPYRPDQEAVDLARVGEGIRQAYQSRLLAKGHPDLRIYLECGRMVTGPFGYLVSRVRHIKKTYKTYAGLDACMSNLMRPALYGAYHHISVPAKTGAPSDTVYDVTGSLCENNDKFAVDRLLPELAPGDLLVIHDAGAHGHAMGFQYNGRLRSAELLLRTDGSVLPIRRAETLDDYFATLDFSALEKF
ncbi:MAG: diaminopimelate decarboxylase [Verrucomicrobiota bacterium]|jgi:diaminopimelate decarboxylase|nr:diaminopimelate decarboxylase [Verrucomicrobiota bacterium]